MHRTRRRLLLALSVVAAIALLSYPAQGSPSRPHVAAGAGRVYTETNAKRNQIVIFNRRANGSLVRLTAVSTGGAGATGRAGCTRAQVCPFIDSQGQLDLTGGGKLLFAVNAGSNTVSSFRVTARGLVLADKKSSGGVFPTSLTNHGNLLYVVNTGSSSIAGLRFSANGKLTPVRGSNHKLGREANPGDARQISFDNTGKVLAVSLLMPGEIQTFAVKPNGTPGAPREFSTHNPLPFGFVFDPSNRIIVTEIHDLGGAHGSTSSYTLDAASGNGTLVDSQPSNGLGPCWITVSADGRFVYVVNTGAGNQKGSTVVVYSLGSAGTLARIQQTTPLQFPNGKPEFERTNELLSADGKNLYVIAHGTDGTKARIDAYSIGSDGMLTLASSTPHTSAPGISGLAGG